ncbi:MAG TPA: hypothetical protein VGC57_02510 [Cellulomonas sp.]
MTSPDPSPHPEGGTPPPETQPDRPRTSPEAVPAPGEPDVATPVRGVPVPAIAQPGPTAPTSPVPSAAPATAPAAAPAPQPAAAWPTPGTYPPTGSTYPIPGDSLDPGAPGAPGSPGAPGWVAPKPPVPFAALLAAGARRAGAGYLLGLLLAFVQTVLLIAISDDVPVGTVTTLPALLVALGLLGSAHASFSGSEVFGSASLDASLSLVPLTVLAAVVVGVVVVAAIERRTNRLPAVEGTLPRDRWIAAALTGGVLTVLASLLAAVLSTSVPDAGVRVGGFGPGLVLGAFVVGALASALGDALGRRGRFEGHRLGLRVRQTGETRSALLSVSVLLGLPAVVLLVVGVIGVAVEDVRGLAALPALGANVLLWMVALVMGGALVGSSSSTVSDYLGAPEQVTLFSAGAPVWAVVLLVLLSVLAALASAVVLAVRRPGAPWSRSWVTAVVFAAAGGVLTVLGAVRYSGGIDLFGTSGSASGWFGIAPWWFLALVAWAGLVETLARYVVPLLVGLLPAGVRATIARRALCVAVPVAGVPGTAVEGATIAAPVPTVAPMSPAARRWTLVGLSAAGVLVVLGVGGAIAVDQINTRAFGPEGVAEDYLAALEDGSASTALELGGAADSGAVDLSGAESALLTDQVYGAATDRPTRGRVTDVQRSGDSATITVEYEQGGQMVTESLYAERDGRTAVLFDRWRLTAPTVGTIGVYLTSDAETLLVNGVEVPVSDAWSLSALPGSYTLALPSSRWTESTEVTATVLGSQWTDVDGPTITPSDALEEEAVGQAEDYLAACLASTEVDPDDCPNSAWVWDDLTGVTWTLDQAPVLALDPAGSWTSGDYDVLTEQAGTATLTGTYTEDSWDHAAGEAYTETVDIELDGYVTVSGDSVTFHYGWY